MLHMELLFNGKLTNFERLPQWCFIQGESLARGPKLFSIKNYVIEIMT